MNFTKSFLVKLLFCIFIYLLLSVSLRAQTDRLPFANQLTPFEQETLLSVDLLRQGDADTLLALYLIGSGDIRFNSQFQSVQKDINRFLKQHANLLNHQDEEKRAQTLHDAMHAYFFVGGNSGDNAGKGYDFDQSKLSGVFATEKFNCVSSSLLYIVLARKLNLDVKGVVLPSHIFVQLNINKGETIDIETTSVNGFDVVHDEVFYQREDRSWFEERGLTPSDYQDYLAREVVSPFELGVLNMRNQHTFEENMAFEDRYRLAEIMSHLDLSDVKAQLQRLSFYNNAFVEGDFSFQDSLVFYQKIAPYLEALPAYQSAYQNDSTKLFNLLGWINSQHAYVLVKNGYYQQGIEMINKQLSQLDSNWKDWERIRNNLIVAMSLVAKHYRNNGDFQKAVEILLSAHSNCMLLEQCAAGITVAYSEWAKHTWESEDWEKVVKIYQNYLSLDSRSQAASIFRSNLQGAYNNWANEFIDKEDYQKAKRIYADCMQRARESDRCAKSLQRLNEFLDAH